MSVDPTPILLLGGGGHCRACIDVLERTGRFTIVGIVDRDERRAGEDVLGHPVLGTHDDLPALRRECGHALVTVGQIRTADDRVDLDRRLADLGYARPVVVSPLAHVSPHAALGDGTIVMHHALVNAGARVGSNCILNTKALVEHDARIGDHCHVSTGAVVNGGATVGARSFVGSNATIVHGVDLPDGAFVRAGRLVRSPADVEAAPVG